MKLVQSIKNFFKNKYVNKIIDFLKQGITPKELALAVSIAFVLGIFPVIGSTTILCTLFAIVFRLNMPLIHLVNYSVYPLQLILLVPFMKIGEYIFRFESIKFSLTEIFAMIGDNVFDAIAVLWNVTLQGIGAWLIIAPVISIILFFVLNSAFSRMELVLKKAKNH